MTELVGLIVQYGLGTILAAALIYVILNGKFVFIYQGPRKDPKVGKSRLKPHPP